MTTSKILGVGLTAGLLTACSPQIDDNFCDEQTPCAQRGQACDVMTNRCEQADVDVSSTEDPAPASFMTKAVAFHRGELCVPHEVQSGAPLPVVMRPCLHACVVPSSFEYRQVFECVGSRCEASVLSWVVASSAAQGCPTDAFGSFPEAQCQYPVEIPLTISTTLDSGPITGTMRLEAPYLSNADVEAIAAGGNETINERINQYPQQANRIPDGRDISIMPDKAAPPASCEGGACNCYPIGF